MVAEDRDTAAGRSLHDVGLRSVLTQHVQVGGGHRVEPGAEVDGHAHRFQEDLGQDDRRADVDPDSSVEAVDEAADVSEVGHRRLPDGGAVGDGMHVDDVGAEAPVHGDPDPEANRLRAHRELPVRGLDVQEQPAEPAPEPGFLAGRRLAAAACRFGQTTSGLVGETEPPLPELGRDVLRGAPQGGDLEVVDTAGAVHGDVVDHPTAHEVDEEGGQAHLEDVGPQGDPNGAPRPLGRDDPADQLLEVLAPVESGRESRNREKPGSGSGVVQKSRNATREVRDRSG